MTQPGGGVIGVGTYHRLGTCSKELQQKETEKNTYISHQKKLQHDWAFQLFIIRMNQDGYVVPSLGGCYHSRLLTVLAAVAPFPQRISPSSPLGLEHNCRPRLDISSCCAVFTSRARRFSTFLRLTYHTPPWIGPTLHTTNTIFSNFCY